MENSYFFDKTNSVEDLCDKQQQTLSACTLKTRGDLKRLLPQRASYNAVNKAEQMTENVDILPVAY